MIATPSAPFIAPPQERIGTLKFVLLSVFSVGFFYPVRMSQICGLCARKDANFTWKSLFEAALVSLGIGSIIYTVSAPSLTYFNAQSDKTHLLFSPGGSYYIAIVLGACLSLVLWVLGYFILPACLAFRVRRNLRQMVYEAYGVELKVNVVLLFFFQFFYLNYVLNALETRLQFQPALSEPALKL